MFTSRSSAASVSGDCDIAAPLILGPKKICRSVNIKNYSFFSKGKESSIAIEIRADTHKRLADLSEKDIKKKIRATLYRAKLKISAKQLEREARGFLKGIAEMHPLNKVQLSAKIRLSPGGVFTAARYEKINITIKEDGPEKRLLELSRDDIVAQIGRQVASQRGTMSKGKQEKIAQVFLDRIKKRSAEDWTAPDKAFEKYWAEMEPAPQTDASKKLSQRGVQGSSAKAPSIIQRFRPRPPIQWEPLTPSKSEENLFESEKVSSEAQKLWLLRRPVLDKFRGAVRLDIMNFIFRPEELKKMTGNHNLPDGISVVIKKIPSMIGKEKWADIRTKKDMAAVVQALKQIKRERIEGLNDLRGQFEQAIETASKEYRVSWVELMTETLLVYANASLSNDRDNPLGIKNALNYEDRAVVSIYDGAGSGRFLMSADAFKKILEKGLIEKVASELASPSRSRAFSSLNNFLLNNCLEKTKDWAEDTVMGDDVWNLLNKAFGTLTRDLEKPYQPDRAIPAPIYSRLRSELQNCRTSLKLDGLTLGQVRAAHKTIQTIKLRLDLHRNLTERANRYRHDREVLARRALELADVFSLLAPDQPPSVEIISDLNTEELERLVWGGLLEQASAELLNESGDKTRGRDVPALDPRALSSTDGRSTRTHSSHFLSQYKSKDYSEFEMEKRVSGAGQSAERWTALDREVEKWTDPDRAFEDRSAEMEPDPKSDASKELRTDRQRTKNVTKHIQESGAPTGDPFLQMSGWLDNHAVFSSWSPAAGQERRDA